MASMPPLWQDNVLSTCWRHIRWCYCALSNVKLTRLPASHIAIVAVWSTSPVTIVLLQTALANVMTSSKVCTLISTLGMQEHSILAIQFPVIPTTFSSSRRIRFVVATPIVLIAVSLFFGCNMSTLVWQRRPIYSNRGGRENIHNICRSVYAARDNANVSRNSS
jgi:hypothetical protein